MAQPIPLQSLMTSVASLSTADQDLLIEFIHKKRVEQQRQATQNNRYTPAVPETETPKQNDNMTDGTESKNIQRVQAFQEWIAEHRVLALPTLSEEAMSRESIYGDRG